MEDALRHPVSPAPALLNPAIHLDRVLCRRACDARDPRFDGIFFVAIVTTRIYCRPICPSRLVPLQRSRFFATAAAAEQAGFRPCLRCRPELAPGRARIDAVPRLAEMAAARIAAGALNGRSVNELAAELGVGARQLRRAVQHELGVSPIELAQTHRLLLAKQLLTDTGMSVTRVAFASGFQSLRRFNTLFREHYRINPLALRRSRRGAQLRRDDGDDLLLTLNYRPPLAWEPLLRCLRAGAIPGVERVSERGYARTVGIGAHTGLLAVEAATGATQPVLTLRLSGTLLPEVVALLPRVRALLDLDGEPARIDAHLARNGLDALVTRYPGVRVPGAFDGFEAALRVLLREQAGRSPAETLLGRLAEQFGEPIAVAEYGLTRLLPTAARLAEAGATRLTAAGVSARLSPVLASLAGAIADRVVTLGPVTDPGTAIDAMLNRVPMARATAEQIVWRAMSWPDHFPADDVGLVGGHGVRSAALIDSCRPWRAYAAMHLRLAALEHSPVSPAAAARVRRPRRGLAAEALGARSTGFAAHPR